ncbi:hypothetical protein PUN28_015861 [Cardiocondyla obscurior]|uniref:Uncharacterized protein n=1 Tax=Cardiocondyla obscurior TaxID=286306 RepID=A0AAW2ETD7_9HYME
MREDCGGGGDGGFEATAMSVCTRTPSRPRRWRNVATQPQRKRSITVCIVRAGSVSRFSLTQRRRSRTITPTYEIATNEDKC